MGAVMLFTRAFNDLFMTPHELGISSDRASSFEQPRSPHGWKSFSRNGMYGVSVCDTITTFCSKQRKR